MTALNILMLGCGNMGSAMLRSWLGNTLIKSAHIIDPKPLADDLAQNQAFTYISKIEDLTHSQFDFVLLAIKPQMMDELCPPLHDKIDSGTAIISIAAGTTLAKLEGYFGQQTPLIRIMPNTPAMVNKGISVAIANPHVNGAQKNDITALMQANGQSAWIEDETQMDAITGLSGSGPAYLFAFIEALAKAGTANGLSADLAMQLARQTVIGSAALADASPDTPPSTLRKNVTSPGGTTEAGLNTLSDNGFEKIIESAVSAARKRGEELS